MLITCTVLLIVISVIAHEYGHLRAMQMYGVKVEKMAIGIPVRFLTIKIQHPKFLKGVPVYLSPLLLIGFVKPKKAGAIEKLASHKQLDINGGGIVMNIAFSCFAYAIIASSVSYFLGFCVLGVAVLLTGKIITRYILPFGSLAMAVYIPFVFLASLKAIPDGGYQTSVAMTRVFGSIATWEIAIATAGKISLMLGIANLLPLQPFDGGRIILVYLEKWFPVKAVQYYKTASVLLALVIILTGMSDSIFALGRLAFRGLYS